MVPPAGYRKFHHWNHHSLKAGQKRLVCALQMPLKSLSFPCFSLLKACREAKKQRQLIKVSV